MKSLMMEEKDVNAESLRDRVREIARRHKASWIHLGQCLFTVHKDKLYKNWGYLAFEAYCQKELGLRETTATKLLRSYYFLEKEEPHYVKPEFQDEGEPRAIPNYESVNLLRLAKDNKRLAPEEYAGIRKSVLDSVKEPKEVRAQIKKIMSDQTPEDPSEVRRNRRNAAIRRLVTTLNMTQKELASEKLLPEYLLKQIDDLKSKLQDQIEEK